MGDPLDILHQNGDPDKKWVCRESTTDRGMRLHQVTDWEITVGAYEDVARDHPADAILAWVEAGGKKS